MPIDDLGEAAADFFKMASSGSKDKEAIVCGGIFVTAGIVVVLVLISFVILGILGLNFKSVVSIFEKVKTFVQENSKKISYVAIGVLVALGMVIMASFFLSVGIRFCKRCCSDN